MKRFRAAEPLESAFLQNAQQLALRAGRKRRDFVENDRARSAELEAAELALDCARECAEFMAEEFAFHQVWRKAGAIDFQEGRVAPGAEFMNEASEVIFACAAFTADEKCRCGGGDLLREFEKTLRGGVFRDPRQSLRAHLE